jgi:type III secretory pathway component EscU
MDQNDNSPVTKGDLKKVLKIMLWIFLSVVAILVVIGVIQYSAQRDYIQSRMSEEYRR